MTLEALSSCNEFLNFIIYDTISATSTATPPYNNVHNNSNIDDTSSFLPENALKSQQQEESGTTSVVMQTRQKVMKQSSDNLGAVVQNRKKRRRRPRACKNKEEAEAQRMTHITVERNRRKQMNQHLSVLRSLMPESYVRRGDQASIVGGAIEFVKELEHMLQALEAKKHHLAQRGLRLPSNQETSNDSTIEPMTQPPFAQFFVYPQHTWSLISNNKCSSNSKAAVADIEVSLTETHANLKILSRRSPKQLSRLVAGFQALHLTILHLNVTTLEPLVLYSISAKVEEGCLLSSVDEIAGAVHHILRMIEEEASKACSLLR